jgi:hypothetical protein
MIISAMELTDALRRPPVPLLEVLDKELPPSSDLPLSSTIYFTPSQDARQAQAIYEYFGGPSSNAYSKGDPLMLNEYTARLVGSVRTINGQCRLNDIYGSWLIDTLKFISITAPFLSARQMEVIWKDIETSRCYGGLPDQARDWMGVYKGVSYRDYGKALHYSKKILAIKGEHIKPSLTTNYLMIVALWSHIALNEKKEAAEFAKRYENPNPPLEIRLLTAIANEK